MHRAAVNVHRAPSRIDVLRGLGILGGISLLSWTFSDVEGARVLGLLERAGLWIGLAWAAFVLAALLDITAWRFIIGQFAPRPKRSEVVRIHLASDAVMMSLPLGVFVAEGLRAYLMKRRSGIGVPIGLGVVAGRKHLLLASECAVVGLGAFLGAEVLAEVSPQLIGGSGLPWIAWGIAGVLGAVSFGYAFVLGRGAVARRCLEFAIRWSPAGVVGLLQRARAASSETDGVLGRVFRLPLRTLSVPWLCYVGVWLLEAVETYIVLRALGLPIDFATALCIEGILSFVRSVVSFVPAGLGIQDFGYVVFLRAVGIPDALDAGAAFSLLKRAKESLWIATGYSVLLSVTTTHPKVFEAPDSRTLEAVDGVQS